VFACFAGRRSFICRIRACHKATSGLILHALNQTCRVPLTSRGALPILCSCCNPVTLGVINQWPAGHSTFCTACAECDNLSIVMLRVLTNKNLIDEEIRRILDSGNACYHSVQNLLSSRLLSKNSKIRIYKTIIFPLVLYGCETWSLALREEHRRRVFGNRVLRGIFRPKRDEVTGEWRKLHN
jgi:hypothetical protein